MRPAKVQDVPDGLVGDTDVWLFDDSEKCFVDAHNGIFARNLAVMMARRFRAGKGLL